MENLTCKQSAIHCQRFKDLNTQKFFTINIFSRVISDTGELAYGIKGSKNRYFTENFLITAIYKGNFKQGLCNIKHYPKNQILQTI